MSDEAKHRMAVARTLLLAREAAVHGDHAEALAWLATLEAIGHELSPEDRSMRDEWSRILASQPLAGGLAEGDGHPLAHRTQPARESGS